MNYKCTLQSVQPIGDHVRILSNKLTIIMWVGCHPWGRNR